MAAPKKPAEKPSSGNGKVIVMDTQDDNELGRGEVLPQDVAILNLLEQLEGNAEATVSVYRQGKGGYRDLTLIEEMSIGEFKPIMLRDPPFNGGDFRIHISDGKGFVGNKFLRVEPRPQKAEPLVQSSTPDTLAPMLHAMTTGFQELGKLIVAAATGNKGPSRKDMLEEMQMMAAIVKPPAAPAAPVNSASEVLQAAKQMLGMVESMRPEKSLADAATGGEVSENALLLGMAEKFFKVVGEMRANPQAALPPVQQQQAAQPAQQHAQQATPNAEENAMTATMQMFIPVLVNQASLDGDTETYANVILDHAGEQRAIEFLGAPDWLEQIAVHDKRVTEYAEWFGELRTAIIEICRDSQDAAIASAAAKIKLPNDTDSATVPVVTEAKKAETPAP